MSTMTMYRGPKYMATESAIYSRGIDLYLARYLAQVYRRLIRSSIDHALYPTGVRIRAQSGYSLSERLRVRQLGHRERTTTSGPLPAAINCLHVGTSSELGFNVAVPHYATVAMLHAGSLLNQIHSIIRLRVVRSFRAVVERRRAKSPYFLLIRSMGWDNSPATTIAELLFRHILMAATEWWQVVAALCTGGGAVGGIFGTYLLGKRNAQASENNAKTTATSNLQIAEKTAETTLVAKNIEQLFSELNALRTSEHQMRDEIHTNSTLITTLREEVRIEKDKNHEIRMEMRNELDNRDREIQRLNDALFDKEATQAELIKYIQSSVQTEDAIIKIGDIEVRMNSQTNSDEFSRRSKWPPHTSIEEDNDIIG